MMILITEGKQKDNLNGYIEKCGRSMSLEKERDRV
jgi:hypothetical protein